MKEGNPADEPRHLSRRGFLMGVGAVAGAALVGKGLLTGESPEDLKETASSPHDRPIESLSREETMREIVFNEGRIQALLSIEKGASIENNPQNASLEYFLRPYRQAGTCPTEENIGEEIQKLNERNTLLRAYRDRA
jgi:hypothetical protein